MDIQYSILHASSKLFFVHSEQHICAIAAFMSGDGMTPAKQVTNLLVHGQHWMQR